MRNILILLTLLLVLSSCKKDDYEGELTGTWKLENYKYLLTNSVGHENKDLERSVIIQLEDDHKSGNLSGHTVLNDVTAVYSLDGSKLSFHRIVGEEVEEPYWGGKFWDSLSTVDSYYFKNNNKKLFMTYADGLEQMVFKRQ